MGKLLHATITAAAAAGLYNTYAVEAGAPTFVLSKSALDVTAFAVSLLLVFRCVARLVWHCMCVALRLQLVQLGVA
jgi:hypothetical protein